MFVTGQKVDAFMEKNPERSRRPCSCAHALMRDLGESVHRWYRSLLPVESTEPGKS